jgi:hypothetical protein
MVRPRPLFGKKIMRDSIHNEVYRVAIPPVVVTDNTAQVGAWIDRSGFQSLAFAVLTGTLADVDATYAVLMEEADAADKSDCAAVADQDMLSESAGVAPELAAAFTFADDNATRKIGYIGNKQFARITVTPTGNSGNAPLAAMAKLANGSVRPV